jgi:hypothetical protein
MKTARKIIYILGLGHSGSTVLDLLLTTTRKAVGLGQVWNVLTEDTAQTRRRQCSCGASALTCEFWSPILDRIKLGDLPYADRYQVVLENVDRLYGPDTAVIDSSKVASHLAILAREIKKVHLSVVHNIKDVRSFTTSMLDNSQRKGYRRELPELIFYRWYRDNRRAHALATRLLQQPPILVTYEGLCLATEAVADRLERRLGDRFIDPHAPLVSGQAHIISGNRLRLAGSGKSLSYDSRWFTRSEWLRPYFLMLPVRRYNEECLRDLPSLIAGEPVNPQL